MASPLYIVDAFTDKPFSGNPAAVCILDHETDTDILQSVAFEMNLSETAFITPTDQTNVYGLRWFTPTTEVPLCGHATLASAHALWSSGRVETNSKITFRTLSGDLTTSQDSNDSISMDFPAKLCHDFAPPMELLIALDVQAKAVQRNDLNILLELETEDEVKNIAPDLHALANIKDVRAVIVTSRADKDSAYDFISRFFAPAVGVPEDPVTGSAHCALGPYWAKRLGKNPLVGYQASKRGGLVGVEVKDQRVILSGKAVTVVEGSISAI